MEPSEINLDDLSDAELREILRLPDGRDGLRYYLSKPQKIAYIRAQDDDEREAILALARARQVEHHAYLRERRRNGSPDRQLLIEERMGEETWRFLHRERTSGFKDAITGRRAKIAYHLVGTKSGRTLRVTKATLLDAYERLGLVTGWPPARSREVAPEASQAGLRTGAHLGSALTALGPRS